MASTYTERKKALDEIAERSTQNAKRLTQAKSTIDAALADLTAMQTAYSQIVTDINSDATANPSDQAYQNMKLEKDKLVADFLATKTKANAQKTALEGIQ